MYAVCTLSQRLYLFGASICMHRVHSVLHAEVGDYALRRATVAVCGHETG